MPDADYGVHEIPIYSPRLTPLGPRRLGKVYLPEPMCTECRTESEYLIIYVLRKPAGWALPEPMCTEGRTECLIIYVLRKPAGWAVQEVHRV
jgi:hypothetical protein